MVEANRTNQHKSLRIDDLSNHTQLARYSTHVQDLLQALFMLVHFTSGQPGRLTEVLSILHSNSVSDGNRNIFMYQGLVAVVPRYHKGYNRDKSLKITYRFLPRDVGSLLVWYVWLIRPFYASLSAGQERAARTSQFYQSRSSFLWPNKSGSQHRSSAHTAAYMRQITKCHLGDEAGPNLMRHVQITLGRHTEDNSPRVQAMSPEEVEEAIQESYSDAVERQANHTPNTGHSVYAAETAAVFRSQNNTAQLFFKVSTTWHSRLGFTPAISPAEARTAMPPQRCPVPFNINLRVLLQETLGQTAQFRGQQRLVLESIMDDEAAVAYIAGTGSGKSLAFLLPACCEEYGQTIVVTPLVALRLNLHERCHQMSITTSLFGAPAFNETARIIFAMPEQLEHNTFASLVHRLRGTGRLRRIVLDKCHYVLLNDNEYRPQLLAVRQLTRFAVPLTLLTATLPPSLQQEAFRLLGMGSNVRVFREPTVRKNIRYEVDSTYSTERFTVDRMAAYVRERQSRYGKILVYLALARDVDALSARLGAWAYHGQISEQAKSKIQSDFHAARSGVVVATSSFNAGVDIPDIRLVLRIGLPDHPITFLQESGRGGRDGLPCVATVVLGEGIPSFLDQQPPPARQVVHDVITRGQVLSGCLRVPIDRYIDGDGRRVGCRAGEEPCSHCAGLSVHPTTIPPSSSTRPASAVETPRTKHTGCSQPQTPATSLQPSIDALSFCQTGNSPAATSASSAGRAGVRGQDTALPTMDLQSSPLPCTPARSSQTHLAGHKRLHSYGTSPPMHTSSPSLQAEHDSAKRSRMQRELDFNRNCSVEQRRAGARLLVEIRDTATFWTQNCVKCLTDNEDYDHPKSECAKYTKDLVNAFRREKLRGKLSSNMCYWCGLPMSLCDKWLDSTTKDTRNKPDKLVECTYPHAIYDAWACLWEYDHEVRKAWLARIKSETAGAETEGLDRSDVTQFAKYFTATVPVAGGKPIGRIPYDVNWVTQVYLRQLRGVIG
ncbi:hypothetical protein B5807_04037 [Epicoccum nigrum]|uniref:DNA 3'-5' helicase n=1 Tax=Epicoccum nigrum TaxID=105696 RepID=A0A1Y2M709_EPING|nr:hypothetical protein B5807_04037 [Epicoccum nigrum]